MKSTLPLITDGVLQTLSVPPLLGRWLLPADQNPHGPKAVMLSYGYWQRRFGGDRSAIGRSIEDRFAAPANRRRDAAGVRVGECGLRCDCAARL